MAWGTLELSRFEGAQHRELAVTVGTERWERGRERVAEKKEFGKFLNIIVEVPVCVSECACVCV